MKLSVHHITENREFSADIGLFVRQCTDWKYSWGLGHSVPPGTSVVLVPAEIFLEYRKRYPKEDSKFVEVVYGASKHLAGCYLAGCADYLKNDWDNTELFHRISRLVYHGAYHLKRPFLIVRPSFIEVNSHAIAISAREYSILKILLQNINQVVPRVVFSEVLFNAPSTESNRMIDVYMCSIRKKLTRVLSRYVVQRMIQTVYASGYRMVDNVGE